VEIPATNIKPQIQPAAVLKPWTVRHQSRERCDHVRVALVRIPSNMSELVRDYERPLDIQERVADQRFLRERVEHAFDSGSMKPRVADSSDLYPICRFPFRAIDDSNNTPYPNRGFGSRLFFIVRLFLFF